MDSDTTGLADALRERYVLEDELGRGGMAVVYRARDVRYDRPVAIKVLPGGLDGIDDEARFEQEVRTTAQLNHPHILPLFDAGRAAGHRYFVMPVVTGATLKDRVERDGRLPPDEAVALTVQVARALAYSHRNGIVHRDVKPGNILLHEGQPVVSDFGVALATGAGSRITAHGMSVGTPHYMSPEQVGTAEQPDGRSDQYGLACVLYELIEGTPPFPGESARAVITAHLVSPPPPLRGADPVSRRLSAVLQRALAKDRSERFDDMEAFANALEAAAAPEPEPSRPGLLVLPFANLSSDPENEYFSDGLTEEVITDLSRIRGIRVISRTSSMRLKDADRDLRSIAAELRVRHVLEGSVRKAGDSLRITARLIDAQAEEPLWSERFDGTVDDVFEIQESVARSIVDALRVRLSPAEDRALAERPIADPRAYESYLRARYEAWRFSPESLGRARRYIENALDIVGDNALLYGTLGHITIMYVETGVDTDPHALDRVAELTDRVFALDPDSGRGHWLRSFLAFQQGDLANAILSGERARASAPDDPDTLALLGYIYTHAGRNEEARTVAEHAAAIDPLTPVSQLMPGFVAVMDGRVDDAVEPYRRAFEMDPEGPAAQAYYGWALAQVHRVDEAIEVLDAAADRIATGPFASWTRSLARGLEGRTEEAAAAITPALRAAGGTATQFSRALADCWMLAGDHDQALKWLTRSVEMGFLNHGYLAEHAWFFDELRDDPRFQDLLADIRARAAALP